MRGDEEEYERKENCTKVEKTDGREGGVVVVEVWKEDSGKAIRFL